MSLLEGIVVDLLVLLAPYIRFDWPLIVVDAPKLKSAYAKAGQTTVIPVTNDVAEVSGFTSEKWRIEISWIMVKRNCSKNQVASPMQAIHFRGNIPRKVPSIPGSAAEFVVWFVADVCDHWIALLDKAGQQLVEIVSHLIYNVPFSIPLTYSLLSSA